MEELDVGIGGTAAVLDGEVVASLQVDDTAVEADVSGRSQASQVLRAVETLLLRRLLGLLYRLSPGPGEQRHEAGLGVLPHVTDFTQSLLRSRDWGCLYLKQIFSLFKLFHLF